MAMPFRRACSNVRGNSSSKLTSRYVARSNAPLPKRSTTRAFTAHRADVFLDAESDESIHREFGTTPLPRYSTPANST
jgi:hypothetical protein